MIIFRLSATRTTRIFRVTKPSKKNVLRSFCAAFISPIFQHNDTTQYNANANELYFHLGDFTFRL